MSKFVAGPWAVQPYQQDHGASLAIVSKKSGYALALIPPLNADDDPNIHTAKRHHADEANARLIAAAPDLLAALRTMLAPHDNGWKVTDWEIRCAEARAAIAKAEGTPDHV